MSNNREDTPASKSDNSGDTVKPWQVIISTLAAGFGVQSRRNRERDFKQGKAGTFIAAGLIVTVLLIASIVLVVNLVLGAAG